MLTCDLHFSFKHFRGCPLSGKLMTYSLNGKAHTLLEILQRKVKCCRPDVIHHIISKV